NDLNSLIQTFQNLESLELSYCSAINLKSTLLSKLKEVCLDVSSMLFLSEVIKNNGENFKSLAIYNDKSTEIIELIGKYCQNIRYLSIRYGNEIDEQLSHIFIQ
ncbi:15272_t:CDS:1, partial [Entrophospora sp. SA101]